jgi:hypothetical protein
MADTPLRSGYAELKAGASQGLGWWSRGEVGIHPMDKQALFVSAGASQREGWDAEVGWRWEFDF